MQTKRAAVRWVGTRIGIVCVFSVLGCAPGYDTAKPTVHGETDNPRNVILVIGDGMGPQQLGLLELYAQISRRNESAFKRLAAKSDLSLVVPVAAGALVVDSGCSATSLASGVPALPQTLGLDAHGQQVESLLDRAKRAGKSVGLVSDTRITHATPAAFIAHVARRDDEFEIARQIALSDADILLSGGAKYFSRLLASAESNGFSIATNRGELRAQIDAGRRVLGLFAPSSMSDAISDAALERIGRASTSPPSLEEMTEGALSGLARNARGFFLMVEAGQIDWAGHANDAGWLLHEMQRIERVIELLMQWQAKNPDTLLVVTADHETGGFGFSYSAANVPAPRPLNKSDARANWYAPGYNFGSPQVLAKLAQQKRTAADMFKLYSELPDANRTPEALRDLIVDNTGFLLSVEETSSVLAQQSNPYFDPDSDELSMRFVPKISDFSAFYLKNRDRQTARLARLLAPRTGIVWATGTHTSTPVPVFATGPGQTRLRGLTTQVEVGQALGALVE